MSVGRSQEHGLQVVKREGCQEEPGAGTYLSGISKLLSSPLSLKMTMILMPAVLKLPIVAVQLLSCAQLFVTPGTRTHQAFLSFTISQSLLKFMSIESMMPSNRLILRCPFSFCPQSFPASGSFLLSQLFTSGGQSVGASASASVLPMNIQG